MTTLRVMRGLPGSGKTTQAIAWVAENPTGRVRVNRDDTRLMNMNAYVLEHGREDIITLGQNAMVQAYLTAGLDVVVDDTNLSSRAVKNWRSVAAKANAEIEFVDVTTHVDECVRRAKFRAEGGGRDVPEHVIREMHAKYFRKGNLPPIAQEKPLLTFQPYVDDPSLPEVLLCDLDGTMAKNNSGRGFYDWARVGEDDLIEATHRVVNALHSQGVKVIFFSGRDAVCRNECIEWLTKHGFENPELYMRPAGSMEPDDKVKLDLFNRIIRDRYRVVAVFDDRISVCRLWHNLGLPLFRVGDPDAVF